MYVSTPTPTPMLYVIYLMTKILNQIVHFFSFPYIPHAENATLEQLGISVIIESSVQTRNQRYLAQDSIIIVVTK